MDKNTIKEMRKKVLDALNNANIGGGLNFGFNEACDLTVKVFDAEIAFIDKQVSAELGRSEKDQLLTIGKAMYAKDGHPYWWGRKSMPKLAARGLVEPHPKEPKAWHITEAGKAKLAELFPNKVF